MDAGLKFFWFLFVGVIFVAAVFHPSTASSVKRTIHRQSHHMRHRRQLGAGYFFSQNVSFGLGPPAPGSEYGPWGPWTEKSDCSRSCGGGIAFQDRICTDVRTSGHHTCVGSSRRYFSCNIEACPDNSKDFRSEQCARFNSIPYEGKHYSWFPYYKGQNPCELNCMPQGLGFYTRLARKVIDGTRCYDDGSLDVCVDGICMPVGCDKILGSTTKEDECRVCGGDGSSCQIVKGVFDKDNFEVGYNDILLIPAGATLIDIKELRPTNNYLAIRNAHGQFYLNGDWRIEFPRDLKIAGTVFHYERKPHGFLTPESLRARGPTSEPLFIVLLYQATNLGVSYQYSIPVGVSTAKPDSYSWTFGDFEECTQTCGGGLQHRPVRCVRNSDRDIVDEGLCDPLSKPPMNISCNTQACPASWQMGEWTNCSHPCGGGSQFRFVYCHQVKEGSSTAFAPEEMCEGEKPLFMKACNVDVVCPEWVTGQWLECNQSCGVGLRSRTVECQYSKNNETADETFCNSSNKPNEVEECTNGPCEGVEWILSDWSGCEGSCSPRMESREAHCANENGVIFPDDACRLDKLPERTRACPKSAMCEPMWHASEWTECSATCGNGVQSRVVFCGVWEESSVMKITDDKCLSEKKFEEVQNCSSKACDGVWFAGPWNRCTAPCGGAERSRKILCFHENEVVNDSNCNENEKPFETESCNMMSCDGDEIMLFDGCKKSEYGCCPDGLTPAGYNFAGCPKQTIGDNVTCEDAEFGCCADQFTLAIGPFKKGCSSLLPCNKTDFGCCPDDITPANGPDFADCPDASNCTNTTYGCCSDGITMGQDEDLSNCLPTSDVSPDVDLESSGEDCREAVFGCCPDQITSALGPLNEGCNEEMNFTTFENCTSSPFGCCEDNVTAAIGKFMEGCMEYEGSGEEEDFKHCNETIFGCCPDNVTTAKGYDNDGCPEQVDCDNSTYGCCPNNLTLASGPNGEGCMEASCSNSSFGCCPDNTTLAFGLDFEGCINVTTLCNETIFGCCPDNSTIALGLRKEGCNCVESEFGCCPDNITFAEGGCDCENSTFGCCPDNVTFASGDDFYGCNINDTDTLLTTATSTTLETEIAECENTLFGCCPDMKTLALGPNLEGCCFGLKFGCCPDNLTAALGPQFRGCSCYTYPYGCCPDGITPAQGYRYHGCRCEHFRYGCCSDNQTPATGPNFEGCKCQEMRFGCCPDGLTPMAGPNGEGCGCTATRYGCCPDGKTMATSADFTGCPCDTLPYGCCPDEKTPARTSDHRDCLCDKQRYGCCLDGRTSAQGPNYEGCPCESTRFGCCLDGRSVSQGPDFEGCPCEATIYGCCADGFTRSQGPNKEGCPKVQYPEEKISPEVCSLPKDVGPCREFAVKWFFDIKYGGCSRFWYGGCSGNGNLFDTLEHCERACVLPTGSDACLLPKVVGPCEDKHLSYYYDDATKACEEFSYSGCLGNNNRFTSKEMCEHTCIMQEPMKPVDVCSLQKDRGPCDQSLLQWYYNKEAKRCERFFYGGCRGNMNKFETRSECEAKCVPTVMIEKDICRQAQVVGDCIHFRERWYYDSEASQCHRFYYGGCNGNDNNFGSFHECEKRCGKDSAVTISPMEDFKIEFCVLDKAPGSCSKSELYWYYDRTDGVCKEFYYGGCEGNGNRFKTKRACEAACENSQDICRLPVIKGPCSGSFTQWYYDHASDECFEFVYSGCKGNANRFNGKSGCQEQCSKEVTSTEPPVLSEGSDLCMLPQEPGPCRAYFRMWYYDSNENSCKSFVYGGCDGNDNRFEKRTDCEQKCVQKFTRAPPILLPDSSNVANEDVCRLSVDPGPCTEAHKRWFYDAQSQSCLPFVYRGCGGNKNRFKSVDICYRFCTGIKAVPAVDDQIAVAYSPPLSSVTTTVVVPTVCPPSNCVNIQCPFGIEETVTIPGCSTCRCTNPCETHNCPEGSRCAVDVIRTSEGETQTDPVCRKTHKLGECPVMPSNEINTKFVDSQRNCANRCRDDADCRGDHKCCNSGCALVCMQPEDIFVPATQPEAARIIPGPNITRGRVGEPSKLPCQAVGFPKPTVTWWRETTMLPLSSSRYEQQHDFSLLIRTVRYEDRGDYSCQAHNGIGPGASFTVTLIVEVYGPLNDFYERPSYPPYHTTDHIESNVGNYDRQVMIPNKEPQNLPSYDEMDRYGSKQKMDVPKDNRHVPLSATISLLDSAPKAGTSIQIHCIVHGPPTGVEVTWYFEGSQIRPDNRREMLPNYTLTVRKTETSDSGEYTCSAKHGESVASSSVTVHVEANSSEDPTCMDSPQFANCEVIVKAKYCNNKYYGKYCCASCKQAGQLQH